MKTPYDQLPKFEGLFYIAAWISGYLWAVSQIFYLSREKEDAYYHSGYLVEGWKQYLGHYQDDNDYEWSFWDKFLLQTVIIGFSGHFILARISDVFWPTHRFKVFVLYSIIFHVQFLGIHGLIFIWSHFAIQYAVARLTRSIAACWVTGLILVYSLSNKEFFSLAKSFYEDDDDAYFLLFSTAMCNLRYIAFSIEYIWSLNDKEESADVVKEETKAKVQKGAVQNVGNVRKRKHNNEEVERTLATKQEKIVPPSMSFFDLLVYQMYFPLMYGGPIMNYNDFREQIKRPPVIWTKQRTILFLFGLLRFLFWHLFLEIVLHFMYFSTMQRDSIAIKTMSLLALCGLALCHVQFFCMKYVIMYGFPAHFASSDNLDVLGAPHCVSGKHRFTDMWKHFDKGLHNWLVRYIHIPSQSLIFRSSSLRYVAGTIASFAFVSFWHGGRKYHVIWALLNWLGIFIEKMSEKMYNAKMVKDFEMKYLSFLSPAMKRRIKAVLYSLTFGQLIISNMYFLTGTFAGNNYMHRIYTEDLWSTILIHVVLYMGVNSSMEFSNFGF